MRIEEAIEIIDSLMKDRKRLANIIAYLENRIELMHLDKSESETGDAAFHRRNWLEKESLHTEDL